MCACWIPQCIMTNKQSKWATFGKQNWRWGMNLMLGKHAEALAYVIPKRVLVHFDSRTVVMEVETRWDWSYTLIWCIHCLATMNHFRSWLYLGCDFNSTSKISANRSVHHSWHLQYQDAKGHQQWTAAGREKKGKDIRSSVSTTVQYSNQSGNTPCTTQPQMGFQLRGVQL